MNMTEKAALLLPERFRHALCSADGALIEEIRLRRGRAPTILCCGAERKISEDRVSGADLGRLLEIATGASLHTSSQALAEGYLSYQGMRIGICGTAVIRDGALCGFRELSSAAIRLPRACPGICDAVLEEICREGFQSTLILAPPGGGKTTALRELIRSLSERGERVGVVDERNELAAMDAGSAAFDLGKHTDVMTGTGKAQGAMLLLRCMNPQIIAMDELSNPQDLAAVEQVFGCGVKLLSSIHAADRDELKLRADCKALLGKRIFRYLITIRGVGAARRYELERIEG